MRRLRLCPLDASAFWQPSHGGAASHLLPQEVSTSQAPALDQALCYGYISKPFQPPLTVCDD